MSRSPCAGSSQESQLHAWQAPAELSRAQPSPPWPLYSRVPVGLMENPVSLELATSCRLVVLALSMNGPGIQGDRQSNLPFAPTPLGHLHC